MPIVTFEPSGKTVEVSKGSLLFDAACRASLPVASSCSQEIVCGKCVMQVPQGAENLSPISQWEQKLLTRDKRPPGDRISCMARIESNCTITTTYW